MTVLKFATYAEALAAGYRPCGRDYGDKDHSNGGAEYFGYKYVAADGRESVTVTLTEVKNATGRLPSSATMMALNPGVTADQEAGAALTRRQHEAALREANQQW